MVNSEDVYGFFWMQYHGRVRGDDLPLWYIEYDKRIVCCNNGCHIKDRCLLYHRFVEHCRVFRMDLKKEESILRRDLLGWERPRWDVYYPSRDYRSGSFAICPDQNGVVCGYLVNKDEKDE